MTQGHDTVRVVEECCTFSFFESWFSVVQEDVLRRRQCGDFCSCGVSSFVTSLVARTVEA